jgi:hypothetical protein
MDLHKLFVNYLLYNDLAPTILKMMLFPRRRESNKDQLSWSILFYQSDLLFSYPFFYLFFTRNYSRFAIKRPLRPYSGHLPCQQRLF